MAEPIVSEEELIAWIDGELAGDAAERVARAVAADSALAARAAAHRRLAARMTAAFGPIAERPVALPRPSAEVVSFAAARAKRESISRSFIQRWALSGSIAASLLIGILVGQQGLGVGGIADSAGALALAPPIAAALDGKLSGDPGPVRISLSFRDQSGGYCRSFAARHIDGIACRDGGAWQLRYAAPTNTPTTPYRMAAGDSAMAAAVAGLIAGAPLDAAGERRARAAGWK